MRYYKSFLPAHSLEKLYIISWMFCCPKIVLDHVVRTKFLSKCCKRPVYSVSCDTQGYTKGCMGVIIGQGAVMDISGLLHV